MGQWAADSNRLKTLPRNWPQLRTAQLKADNYVCQWGSLEEDRVAPSFRCRRKANQADHYGEAHEHDKLRSLCQPHHAKRSARQGAAASGKARTERAAARFRTPNRHPGLLTPEQTAAKRAALGLPPLPTEP